MIGSPHLINKLASETDNREAAWYRDFLGEGNDIFDIIWPRPDFVGVPPKESSKHFRTLDWWVMRSDFGSVDKVLVAGKAGMNDDPHHGHLDIGQFVVHWKGEYFIQDLGRIGYDEKYFDEARFDYPEASSIGHNVLFVNGEKQISGKYYKQPYDYSVGGKVLQFTTSEKQDYVIMDPTNAYPKKELKKWRRHVLLEKPEVVVVIDEVQANPGSKIEVRFHPGVDHEKKEGYVMLSGKDGKMALIPLTDNEFDIVPGRHASQFVNATKDFHWLDYFDTEVTSKNDKTIIGTVILPVKSSDEAREISNSSEFTLADSGELSLSFSKMGINYAYTFQNGKDGLKLIIK